MRRLAFFAAVVLACGTSSTTNGDGGTKGDAGPGSTCRSQNDCGSGEYCGVQSLAPMCNGSCQPRFGSGTCSTDADCADAGAGMICSSSANPGPCWCSSGGAQPIPLCIAGCATAADCGPGLSCDGATHRCVAAACTQPGDCGTNDLTCNAQKCAPKSCSSDGDCAHYCVFNTCSIELGACAAAVP